MMSEGFKSYAKDLLKDQSHSDITIIVDNDLETPTATVSFHAHRLVLATMSDYFRTMLYGQFIEANRSEIRLYGVNNSTFQQCLWFMYNGWDESLDGMSLEEGFKFYSMARMFLMEKKVESSYTTWITGNIMKWEKQLWAIFSMSIECNLSLVVCYCKKLFSDVASEFLIADEFLTVPLSVVRKVLSCEKLNCSKKDLQKAIKRWIVHNKIDRLVKKDLLEFVKNKKAPFLKGKKINLYDTLEPRMQQEHMDLSTVNPNCGTEPTLHSYSSTMVFNKCIMLAGVSVVFKRNPNSDEANQTEKSEIALKVEITEHTAGKLTDLEPYVSRSSDIVCDLTERTTQEVCIFFPSIQACIGRRHTFTFSWTGEGVQPVLHKFGKSLKTLASAEDSYVLGIYRSPATSNGRSACEDCRPSYYHRGARLWFTARTDSEDEESDQMSF